MKLVETLYQISIENEIIQDNISLNEFPPSKWYCTSIDIEKIRNMPPVHLVSVYDLPGKSINKITDIGNLQKDQLLFGRVLSERFSSRGKNRFIKIDSREIDMEDLRLPYFRYNSSLSGATTGDWFYIEPYKYYIFEAKKSTFNSVIHLETLAIYTEEIIKLRIIVEFLRRQKNYVNKTQKDYVNIGFNYFQREPFGKIIDQDTLRYGIQRWVEEFMITPPLPSIPEVIFEKPRD